MAMARVCDACGKPVRAPFRQMKVTAADTDEQEPRNYKTIKSMDFHVKCYTGFTEWIKEIQNKSGMFITELPDITNIKEDLAQT